MGEVFNEKNLVQLKKNQRCLASCDMCRVKFLSEDQLNQHKLYHKSEEFYNFWLRLYKNQPSYLLEDTPLEFLENSKFSKYNKFKPTEKNSVAKVQNQKDWELSWAEWDEKNSEK